MFEKGISIFIFPFLPKRTCFLKGEGVGGVGRLSNKKNRAVWQPPDLLANIFPYDRHAHASWAAATS